MKALLGAVTTTGSAHLRGAYTYTSALAQWAVFAKRKYVVPLDDDDDDDAAKPALAATMARVLSRFVQRSLKQLEVHRALLAPYFVATHDTDAQCGELWTQELDEWRRVKMSLFHADTLEVAVARTLDTLSHPSYHKKQSAMRCLAQLGKMSHAAQAGLRRTGSVARARVGRKVDAL